MSVKCVSIQNAVAGMVLARSVIDENGRTLCGENTVLTEKLISQFQRNNINGLYVISNDKLTEEEYKKQKMEIEFRFSGLPAKSILLELKKLLLEQLEAKK